MSHDHAERAEEMFSKFDKNPTIKQAFARWHEHNKSKPGATKYCKTATGKTHRCMKLSENDMRILVPKSEGFEKKKDGKGLFGMLQNVGVIGADKSEFKITYSWVVCYIMGIRVDKTKAGWKNFECSHICIEDGVKEQAGAAEFRCVDDKCLVWESKSENQSRADKSCRKECHCGCGTNICAANKTHNPPCH